uniref:Ribonuclease VapC n=1 Tax=Caulobacter sp. (strain K31) TaxID=366602 RepID=B0T8G6_CAUSK
MIAVDTSALMAIVLKEPAMPRCVAALAVDSEAMISAGTLSEALVVAGQRGVAEQMAALVEGLALTVVPVSEGVARRVAEVYALWGKGRHPARLNWGDCFSYVTARDHGCPLLFVGDDFARTDVASA